MRPFALAALLSSLILADAGTAAAATTRCGDRRTFMREKQVELPRWNNESCARVFSAGEGFGRLLSDSQIVKETLTQANDRGRKFESECPSAGKWDGKIGLAVISNIRIHPMGAPAAREVFCVAKIQATVAWPR